MYSDDNASPAELRTRFGIGPSSLYRMLQKQGVPLRARSAAAPRAPETAHRPPAVAQKTSRPRQARSGLDNLPSDARPANGATLQFRVIYRGVQVLQAADIRDALHHIESLGATDVFEIKQQV
jgi:hypothetical protein